MVILSGVDSNDPPKKRMKKPAASPFLCPLPVRSCVRCPPPPLGPPQACMPLPISSSRGQWAPHRGQVRSGVCFVQGVCMARWRHLYQGPRLRLRIRPGLPAPPDPPGSESRDTPPEKGLVHPITWYIQVITDLGVHPPPKVFCGTQVV